MVKYSGRHLDSVFSALADSTRRGILAALAGGGQPVSELAKPFGMSLPGFMKHLRVLEQARLVHRVKEGRVVNCTLEGGPMREAADWLDRYRQFWEQRLDALGRYLEKESSSWPQSKKKPRSRSNASSKRLPKKSGTRSRDLKR